jgi:N-acetylglucosaminyldiphosphoundecaprenol N-acetyl-beta-D-mannosaminyltransferase
MKRTAAPEPVAILGVPFDNVTLPEALERIEQMIASRRPHYVATANVDFLVQAREDVELHRILAEADLVLCDGMPLVWASRLLGNPLPERVAGADLVPRLIEIAAQRGYRLFFLCASPAAAEQAVARLRARLPKVLIAGHYSPPYRKLLEMDHDEIRRRILQARPDVLLVAFGCPKQEKWSAMHYRQLGVPVVIGVGATIDFLGGRVRRAPQWMQRAGLEWVFRLGQEPRRLFHRYIKDLGSFTCALLVQYWLLARPFSRACGHRTLEPSHDPAPGASPYPGEGGSGEGTLDLQCMRPSGHMGGTIDALEPQRILPASAAGPGIGEGIWLLDLSGVRALDSTGVAKLMRRQRDIAKAGCQLCLIAPRPAVRRALVQMRVADFLLCAPDRPALQSLLQARPGSGQAKVINADNRVEPVLAWRGEITAASASQVWEQTRAALSRQPPGEGWSIDLADVHFIDSTGLGVMVRSKRWARRLRQPLCFINPQPAVRNVVRLADLENSLLDGASAVEDPRPWLLLPEPAPDSG